MTDKLPFPSDKELRALAYRMKQDTGMKIGHAYEAIAKQNGFKTYAAMRAAIKLITSQQGENHDR